MFSASNAAIYKYIPEYCIQTASGYSTGYSTGNHMSGASKNPRVQDLFWSIRMPELVWKKCKQTDFYIPHTLIFLGASLLSKFGPFGLVTGQEKQ